MSTQPLRVKFTVGDYYKMIECGILLENSREEIIAGALLRMPPATAPRTALRSKLSEIFYRRFENEFFDVSIDRPVTLDEFNEPIPDFCFWDKDKKRFLGRHPKADEVHLVLEIADETLDYDHGVKIPLYAFAEIPEVWLIDLIHDKIEIYSQPSGKMYNSVKAFKRGETIESEILPNLKLEVDEILF